jgi:putative transposase
MQITIKLRLRDRHAAELNRQAAAVSFVWNYCNETQRHAVSWSRPWLSAFDLMKLTAGASKELDLHAHTIQRVCKQYVLSREIHGLPWLRFRSRKSLGWVPFNTGNVNFDGEGFTFRGVRYRPMQLRDVLKPSIKIGAGSFNQDARGRWYLNAPIEIDVSNHAINKRIGIDLGLKHLATLSDGNKIQAPRFYRQNEVALATSQRAHKSKRARNIHAKIRNRRKDFLHKESNRLAKEYGLIVGGDASPKQIIPTQFRNQAKAQHDVSWANFKTMLAYKSIRNGGSMLEVSAGPAQIADAMLGRKAEQV